MKKIYVFIFCLFAVQTFSFSQTVHQVVASNFIFTPSNFSAVVGDTVRFTFGSPPGTGGGALHTTTSIPDSIPAGAANWNDTLNSDIARHLTFDYVVRVPGVYKYICSPHVARFSMRAGFSVSGVTPVKMVSFSAQNTGEKAQLNWQTASEENSHHFSVQQSLNGLDFTDVGTVAAAGSSNAPIKYSFTVNNMPSNTRFLYFRLLTIDKDAKQQYSDIVMLQLENIVEKTFIKKFYPNPAENGDHLYFDFDAGHNDHIQLSIYETSGKLLFSTQGIALQGVNQSHLPMPKLRKGAYYVQFTMSGQKQTLPLFVK